MARITHGDEMHRDPGAAAHIADATDAHDASAISVLDTGGNFTGTDVEAVLAELDAAIGGGGHAEDHATRHEAGGADEIDVTGLVGAGGGGGRTISRTQSLIQDDCWHPPSTDVFDGGVQAVTSGGGSVGIEGEAGHPGIVGIHTSTSATGRATLLTSTMLQSIVPGAATIRFGLVGKILGPISDGTERYTIRLGLGDSSAGDHTDGVYFRVVDNVNGGEWQGVTRAATSESVLDTNVAADTAWHTFEFEINDDATSVEFFIDGTSVGTISATIPTGTGQEVGPVPAGIIKSLGNTRRDFYVDAYWYHWDFVTSR